MNEFGYDRIEEEISTWSRHDDMVLLNKNEYKIIPNKDNIIEVLNAHLHYKEILIKDYEGLQDLPIIVESVYNHYNYIPQDTINYYKNMIDTTGEFELLRFTEDNILEFKYVMTFEFYHSLKTEKFNPHYCNYIQYSSNSNIYDEYNSLYNKIINNINIEPFIIKVGKYDKPIFYLNNHIKSLMYLFPMLYTNMPYNIYKDISIPSDVFIINDENIINYMNKISDIILKKGISRPLIMEVRWGNITSMSQTDYLKLILFKILQIPQIPVCLYHPIGYGSSMIASRPIDIINQQMNPYTKPNVSKEMYLKISELVYPYFIFYNEDYIMDFINGKDITGKYKTTVDTTNLRDLDKLKNYTMILN